MTSVFFLFLARFALGLLLTLPFVPERAGASYFKFVTACATFCSTAGLGLLLRRYGWGEAPTAPAGAAYPLLLAAWSLSLLGLVFLNRAWHFGWARLRPALAAVALAAGFGALALAAPAEGRALVLASDLSASLLLGAAAAAMILGHWYLVVHDLPIAALRRLTLLLVAALLLRSLVLAAALFHPAHSGLSALLAVAAGRFDLDGVFVWMRLLFGIVGPCSLIGFIWKTVEIRSTQSATGILYVQLFLVLSGELLATHLRVAAGFTL